MYQSLRASRMISTFRSKLWVLKAIEVFNFIKGMDDMFNFFTDIKNRLTAIEAHIEAIYAHLSAAKKEAVVVAVTQAEVERTVRAIEAVVPVGPATEAPKDAA